MSRPEAPTSSKRFVKKRILHYKASKIVEKVFRKTDLSIEDDLTRIFSDQFSFKIQAEFVDRGASFDKVRDAYEKTISELTELSRKKEDLLAQRIADRLISDGKVTLLSLNPKFNSDKWYKDQKKIVYPGIVFISPKSSSVYA